MNNKYRVLCKEARVPEGRLTKEFLFTVENADYFYFDRNIGTRDIIDGFVDGTGDGGIDFIYSDDDVLYLLQGKSSDSISINDIKSIFNKMIITIEKINRNQINGLSKNLVANYLNAYDSLSDLKKITLVLFTNATLTKSLRNSITELKEMSEFAKYNIVVYDSLDIESKKLTSSDAEYVKEYKLLLVDANNKLEYNQNGYIVNASANSIKRLYQSKSNNGLFSYNLREHVKQANVDNAIDKTIEEEPENFWFYNNGITIGCEDFVVDGNSVKLYNFSIINGAQTTTKIGESASVRDGNDFAVVCKIVKPLTTLKSNYDFLMKISEASNSQKPIRPRDLKANLPEQKILQKKAEKNEKPLAIEIKRGVKAANYGKVEPWQRVSNDLVGQLILSCILQKPGDAKVSSSSIFDKPSIYVPVFKRRHDYNTLYDIVKLYNYFEEFRVDYIKQNDDIDLISVAKVGKYTVLAVICYMFKRVNEIVSNRLDQNVFEDNLSGDIFSNDRADDFKDRLNDLFEYVIGIINLSYQNKKADLKLTSHTAFLKNDSYYANYVLKMVDNGFSSRFDSQKIMYYMSVFKTNNNVLVTA